MKKIILKEIHQRGDKKHQDSFWFDGHVATLSMLDKKGNIRYINIYAEGDIRIHNKEGELVYDGKERNCGLPEFKKGLRTDKDLVKLDKFGYTWENNNWFCFLYSINDGNADDSMGNISHTFNEAIEQSREALTDEKFWKQFDKA